ncbi:MAG: SHOCT domain-containing protein [Eubacteriales bacterium]
MFLGLLVVVLVVYLLVKNTKPSLNSDNSESILKERLAKGEINEEEYDSLIKKVRK